MTNLLIIILLVSILLSMWIVYFKLRKKMREFHDFNVGEHRTMQQMYLMSNKKQTK